MPLATGDPILKVTHKIESLKRNLADSDPDLKYQRFSGVYFCVCDYDLIK